MSGDSISKQAELLPLGPIDILVLEFKGNNFSGEILRNLTDLVAAGTIRIIDLVLITKGDSGLIAAMEISDLGKEAREELAPLRATISQMLTNDDIYAIGHKLGEGTTAAVMLYENTWAVQTKKAMIEANGRVLAFERIPHEIIVQSLEDLAAAGAAII